MRHSDHTPAQVVITGRLLNDAEWRVTSGQIPVGFIFGFIDQPLAQPVRFQQLVGSEPGRMLAGSAKARSMRRGDPVKVYGTKLMVHGYVLELMGITDIVPIEIHHPATQEG